MDLKVCTVQQVQSFWDVILCEYGVVMFYIRSVQLAHAGAGSFGQVNHPEEFGLAPQRGWELTYRVRSMGLVQPTAGIRTYIQISAKSFKMKKKVLDKDSLNDDRILCCHQVRSDVVVMKVNMQHSERPFKGMQAAIHEVI